VEKSCCHRLILTCAFVDALAHLSESFDRILKCTIQTLTTSWVPEGPNPKLPQMKNEAVTGHREAVL
jgi:hypothetical protein